MYSEVFDLPYRFTLQTQSLDFSLRFTPCPPGRELSKEDGDDMFSCVCTLSNNKILDCQEEFLVLQVSMSIKIMANIITRTAIKSYQTREVE